MTDIFKSLLINPTAEIFLRVINKLDCLLQNRITI